MEETEAGLQRPLYPRYNTEIRLYILYTFSHNGAQTANFNLTI